VQSKKITRVILLATEGTVGFGAYQNLCEENGVDCIIPNDQTQKLVNLVISLVKHGKVERANKVASKISKVIKENDCGAAILGCTELSLVADTIIPKECLMIDTIDVLADTCISYVNEGVVDESR
jgi:aspartate racemase